MTHGWVAMPDGLVALMEKKLLCWMVPRPGAAAAVSTGQLILSQIREGTESQSKGRSQGKSKKVKGHKSLDLIFPTPFLHHSVCGMLGCVITHDG